MRKSWNISFKHLHDGNKYFFSVMRRKQLFLCARYQFIGANWRNKHLSIYRINGAHIFHQIFKKTLNILFGEIKSVRNKIGYNFYYHLAQ